MTLTEYRNTLNTFDLVIIGGGGLIFLGANYFNFLMEGIKVPYIFSRMGVDNRIVSPTVCSDLKNILKAAYHVTVRTSSDKDLAAQHLGLDCEVVPEAIWNYEAEKISFVHSGEKILVSINRYASGFANSVAQTLTNLKIKNTVYTVSMQDSSDDFYYNIKSTPKRVILPEAVSLHKKASFLASSDLVITSRLHAGLIAISHGVPAIMLKSTPKVAFLMKDLELDSLFFKNNLDENIIEDIFTNKQQLKEKLLDLANKMKVKANTDLVAE
jgi:hypothetical protein